jgi:cobalt-zinc-cadmium efflux system membrane fusion protein
MGPTCLSALFQRALSALSILALSLTTMGSPVHAVTYAVGSSIDIPMDERAQRAAGIETQRIEREAGSTEIVLPGNVVVPPHQMRVVSAPAAGLIEVLHVAPDEPIQRGDPIATLRSNNLVEAQRLFLAAVSEETLATERLRRDELLYAEKIIPERRLLVTRAEALQARAALDERKQLLLLHGMSENDVDRLAATRKIVSSLTVLAPQSGTVLSRQATPGERVQEASPLVTIAQLSPLWINLQVPVSRAPTVARDSRVLIPSVGLEGRVIRIGRTVDQSSQSVNVVAEVDGERQLKIRPGQAVNVILRMEQNGVPQWRVPSASVIRHGERSWIFVREVAGFRAQPVQVISENAQSALIAAKLDSDDQVATRGVVALLSELIDASLH